MGKRTVQLLAVGALLALAGCKTTDQPVVDDGGGAPSQTGGGGSGTITSVSGVKLTPEQGDVIQVRASSSKSYSYEQLKAVLYCRAARHAASQGYSGGYPLRFHKLEGTNAAAALVAIASVQLYHGSAPAGKTPLSQSWCSRVPSAAQ